MDGIELVGALSASTTLVSTNSNWSLLTFLDNLPGWAAKYGHRVLIFLGVVSILAGAAFAVIQLLNHKPNQPPRRSWIHIALLIIIGGALAIGGWTMASTVASGGKTTIENLGTSVSDPTAS